MTLTQMNYIITISETGSLNKAAEALYISQPSLTNAVKELEKELGIIIFNRSGRGVTLTNDGTEFLMYARQIYGQYESVVEKYSEGGSYKKKFGVSTQHYSFAVKAFVDMVQKFDVSEYEFAIRETKTADVISDVSTMKSEVGVLYLSDFNRKALLKLLHSANLEFHHLIDCQAYVYLWKNHPLANEKSISYSQLAKYPCLSFEQGDKSSFYLSEEILSTNEYSRTVKASDRATMLNLMVGLNGYTLCSGIICEELNGSDYLAIPFEGDEQNQNSDMEIGYITRKNSILSKVGNLYVSSLKKYLEQNTVSAELYNLYIISHIFPYILLPVFLRAAALYSGEYLGIVVGVCEAGFLGDFHDAVVGAEEKFKAPFHPVFLQKCKQGYVHVSLE